MSSREDHRNDLRREQDDEFEDSIQRDIAQSREKFMNQFFAYSGEALKKLDRQTRGLVRTLQASTRLTDSNSRKFVQLTPKEIDILNATPNLHLWVEDTSCRNMSDQSVRQLTQPMFVTVSKGYVFCFDLDAHLQRMWSTKNFLLASIPFYLPDSETVFLELALTAEESRLALAQTGKIDSPKSKRAISQVTTAPPEPNFEEEQDLLYSGEPQEPIPIDLDTAYQSDEDWNVALALQSELWEEEDVMLID